MRQYERTNRSFPRRKSSVLPCELPRRVAAESERCVRVPDSEYSEPGGGVRRAHKHNKFSEFSLNKTSPSAMHAAALLYACI